MIEGKNSEVVHDGMRYHIQTEFIETDSDFLISQVFLNGQVVYQKKHKIVGAAEEQISFLHDYVIKNIKEMML
jgi:hypothetical protein